MLTMTVSAGTDAIAHALENQFGLADRVVDARSDDATRAVVQELLDESLPATWWW